MNTKTVLTPALIIALAGNIIPVLGQNVYEQSRSGNNTTGTSSPDWTLTGFSATISSLHSSAPGQPAGDSSSRFAGAPVSSSESFTVSPNNTTSQLNMGTTYLVSVTWPNNTTSGQTESPDVLVNATDSGMTGIDTFTGTTGVFKQGTVGNPNYWFTAGLVTVNSATPTFTFTGAGGTTSDRWYADAMQFTPVSALPTAQYWDTGSLGGSGTWDASTQNWKPNSDGSGTPQAYVQGNLAYFGSVGGTVTIANGGITSDGGLLFATNGYVIQGGSLNLGLGTNIIVLGTNVATINSTLSGTNGLCTYGGTGTLLLGMNNVPGAVTPSAGILMLGANTTFGTLAGTGGGVVELQNHTLTVGDSTTNSCNSPIVDTSSSSPGSLVKQGSGQLTLLATNNYHGSTTINAGILAAVNDANFGTAPSALVTNQLVLNGNGATLFGNVGFTINAKRGITVNGPSNYIAMPHALELTISAPITGNGSLIIPSAWVDFNATNTFTGDLLFTTTNNISARFNTNNSAGLGRIIVTPLTALNTAFTLRNFSPTGTTTTLTNAIILNPGGANYNIDTAGATGTFILTGNISGAAPGVNISDNPNGQGNVVLSGNNSGFSGGFNLQGGTLTLGSATALGTGNFQVQSVGNSGGYKLQANTPLTGANAVATPMYWNVPATPSFIMQGSNALELSGKITMGQSINLEISNTASPVISGQLTDDGNQVAFSVNQNGNTGTLTLSGANTYTGGTTVYGGGLDVAPTGSILGAVTVDGGVLEVDNVNGMPSPSVTINSPGTIYLNFNGTTTVGALTINGNPAAAGTWGAIGSTAANQSSAFSGNGVLYVTGGSVTVGVGQATGSAPSTYGSPVSFTASVTGNSPTGSVQFYENGVPFGGLVPLAGGAATSVTISNLGVPNANITAYYFGDANNPPGAAPAYALSIDPLAVQLAEPYNGTTTATTATLYAANVLPGDVVTLTGGPLTLSGSAVGAQAIVSGQVITPNPNYAAAGATSVNIVPLPVVLTGSRGYDGTGLAAASILSVANKVAGDDVSVTPGSGNVTLASASVGTEAITSFGTVTLQGTTAPNYTLTGASGSVTVTNPFNSFTITTAHLDATKTNLVVCWQSVPGVVYNILTNTSVNNGSWVDVGAPISPTAPAATNSTCVTIPGATNVASYVLIKQ